MLVDTIESPKDLKQLSVKELETLAEEIRQGIIHKTSLCGGHVASNLGVVEVTIALHYVFNSPIDKIVFDTSYQCYTHKILTGRKAPFLNDNPTWGGETCHTNPKESKHDFFVLGHTSSSISLACGMARARDLKGEKGNIIAFIGDGSLTGGMAFEGLNVVGEIGTNFIVIVNDNDQTIAESHGASNIHLAKLRETKGKAEDNYFKALGFEYLYVDEGNEIAPLLDTFSRVKDANHPVVVHVHTRKGYGYKFAEENKEGWHKHGPYDITTGQATGPGLGENYGATVRDFLLKKMAKDPTICVITPAMPLTCGFNAEVRGKLGKQFIDVGIAEQHAIAMAAGIARNGGKPIVATLSTFYQRAFDQVSQDMCMNMNAATLLVRNGSVWGVNNDSHLGFFDVALMSNIPNLVYLAPTNCEEYLAMLDWSIDQNEYPVAIRIPCNQVVHTDKPVEKDYSNLNKSLVVQEGDKVALFALGDFFQMGEEFAAAINNKFGFMPTLVNPRYMTGIDTDLLESLKDKHQLIITLEDGIVEGGYGPKVTTYYGTCDMKVVNLGLRKEFVNLYKVDELLQSNGLTRENILNIVETYVQ